MQLKKLIGGILKRLIQLWQQEEKLFAASEVFPQIIVMIRAVPVTV
jgi:hypothetical protein